MGDLEKILQVESLKTSPEKATRFFKTGPGTYGEHDRFLGIPTPVLRRIAKNYTDTSWEDVRTLLTSSYNEHRMLALIFLTNRYKTGSEKDQQFVYDFYRQHMGHVNNWNLVDISAHLILGPHVEGRNEDLLRILMTSPIHWERRVAMVATWHFIRKGRLDLTLALAPLAFQDPQDLMHKATGWMLREVGKRDKETLVHFLNRHHISMPRTMVRYAIERLTDDERFLYKAKR